MARVMANKRKLMVILVGNIGSGKSTLTKKLIKRGFVVVARDSFRYSLGAGEYLYDQQTEPVIWATEGYMIRALCMGGIKLVVDEVGITKHMRSRYLDIAKSTGYKVVIIELPRMSRNKCVARRMHNPHGQADQKLWEAVWDKFNAKYEAPTQDEGKIIHLSEEDVNG